MSTITKTLLNGRVKIGHNTQTYPLEHVISIDPDLKPCEDCNLMVDRTISYTLNQSPYPHWRATCKNCGLLQNPNTGKFEFESAIALNAYLRTKNKHSDK